MTKSNLTTEELVEIKKRLNESRLILLRYLLGKVSDEDFHAVADAAMDIREIDAKLAILSKIESRP